MLLLLFLDVYSLTNQVYLTLHPPQIGEAVQDTMAKTLINHYGVDLYERRNRLITDAWDKAQERVCLLLLRNWTNNELIYLIYYIKPNTILAVLTEIKKLRIPKTDERCNEIIVLILEYFQIYRCLCQLQILELIVILIYVSQVATWGMI